MKSQIINHFSISIEFEFLQTSLVYPVYIKFLSNDDTRLEDFWATGAPSTIIGMEKAGLF